MLANEVAIIFVAVFVVEAALIILGNAFTIFVFSTPTRTSDIRRTCYLLINLAFADLFVGITEPIILGTKKFHDMRATTTKPRWNERDKHTEGKKRKCSTRSMDTRSNATFCIKCIGVFSRPDFPRARFCCVKTVASSCC